MAEESRRTWHSKQQFSVERKFLHNFIFFGEEIKRSLARLDPLKTENRLDPPKTVLQVFVQCEIKVGLAQCDVAPAFMKCARE